MPLGDGEARVRIKPRLGAYSTEPNTTSRASSMGTTSGSPSYPAKKSRTKPCRPRSSMISGPRAFSPRSSRHRPGSRRQTLPGPASDQHRGQAVGPACRILVQWPSGMIADGQASTPRRADPAADQRGPGRPGLRQDGRRADQAVRLRGPDPQRTGDCLGVCPRSRNRRTRSRRSPDCRGTDRRPARHPASPKPSTPTGPDNQPTSARSKPEVKRQAQSAYSK
jgi:hypothetical protein